MVAVAPKYDLYTIFRMDYIQPRSQITSVEDYIAAIEESGRKSYTQFKEISRVPCNFGNSSGIRIEAAWEKDRIKFHGWRSICRKDDVYYMMTGWCQEGRQAEAQPKYQEMEQLFTLTTFPDAK